MCFSPELFHFTNTVTHFDDAASNVAKEQFNRLLCVWDGNTAKTYFVLSQSCLNSWNKLISIGNGLKYSDCACIIFYLFLWFNNILWVNYYLSSTLTAVKNMACGDFTCFSHSLRKFCLNSNAIEPGHHYVSVLIYSWCYSPVQSMCFFHFSDHMCY